METAGRETGRTVSVRASTAITREDELDGAGAGASGWGAGAWRVAQQGRVQAGGAQHAEPDKFAVKAAPCVPASIMPSRNTNAIFAALRITIISWRTWPRLLRAS